MKKGLYGIGLGLLLMATSNSVLQADELKVEEGFTSLFNGKDLSGWQYGRKKNAVDLKGKTQSPDGRIEALNGIIVMNKGRGIRDLFTTQQFDKDFTLRLEFMAGPKADSGVYIRGPQLQIRDFLRRNEQKQLTKFKNDGWNFLEVKVAGREATCTVNGQMLRRMKVPANGGIGLQAESGKFAFRRIRIKTSAD